MNNLQIAIRCGGLVVDLFRYFNYAVVDPEKRTARMGAGTLWATVEKEVIQYGLASVAGTVNHVRVDLLMTCTSCQY
jgi:FAD/FMN-containing dehydrogenase